MRRAWWLAALALAAGCGSAPASPQPGPSVAAVVVPGAKIATVPTRPGVRVRVLHLAPKGAPAGTLVLFPGGNGAGHFALVKGTVEVSNNFLMRNIGLFAAQGWAVAAVDVPSDQPNGMSDAFRTGALHTIDVQQVLAALAKRYPPPQVLVGTSRGTLSVAHLGISLPTPVAGIVLTASMGVSSPNVMSLWDLNIAAITAPVLMVHHRSDACLATPYDQALLIRDALTAPVAFITVGGGLTPISQPCQALSYHGFYGQDAPVVAAIADWASGKPVPEVIGP